MATNDQHDTQQAQFLPTNSAPPSPYVATPGITSTSSSDPAPTAPGGPQFQQTVPPVQNIYITQQVQQGAPAVVLAAPKSVGTALILTFFFGPLGMFYSTVPGAIIMLIASIVLAAFTFGFSILITWPICMIWGAMAASQYNSRIGAQTMTQISR